MKRFELLKRICRSGVVAILRAPDGDVVQIAKALRVGGVEAIEITAETPGVMKHIERLASQLDDVAIGVGTVLDTETARQAILSGAQFIITPTLKPAVIEMANRYDTLITPGVFTPTEILTAAEYGAPAVKVFPAVALGPEYLRQVRAPLSHIPMIPTGGIDLQNIEAFVRAGAAAVGVGSSLVARSDATSGNYEAIAERARAYVEAVASARQ